MWNGPRTMPFYLISAIAFLGLAFFCLALPTRATTVEELRSQIDAKSDEIKKLEEDEQKYQEELSSTTKQVKSLTTRIGGLDIAIKKVNSGIRITEIKISRTKLEIEKLKIEILGKEEVIERERGNLGALARYIQRIDDENIITWITKYPTLASFFGTLESITSVDKSFQEYLAQVKVIHEELGEKQDKTEQKKQELSRLSGDLQDQLALQQSERSQRSLLLAATKNQEKLYQDLLEENHKRQIALEREVADYERQITLIIDPTSLPKAGSGVLGWPLPQILRASCFSGKISEEFNCVTQLFGNTTFARSGAYNGKGHNGVDFRASVGTPIYASESGVVRGIGDTDIGCRGASYGKWVLIDHANNLASLYAHLSLVKASEGQAVRRGELIGYSGISGYATGPHLHLGVFAKQAVRIETLKSRVCGRNMILPISPSNGYLNPLDYL